MTIPRRRCQRPVPHGPSHRRMWRSLWRRCSCGLPAPCVDRLVPAPPLPYPPNTASPADGRPIASGTARPSMPTSARIPAPRASPIRPAQPGYDSAAIARVSPIAYLEAARAACARDPAWPLAGHADRESGRHRLHPHTGGRAPAREPTTPTARHTDPASTRRRPHFDAGRATRARDPATPVDGTAGSARTRLGDDRQPAGAASASILAAPGGFIRASGITAPSEEVRPGDYLPLRNAHEPRDGPRAAGQTQIHRPGDRPEPSNHARVYEPRDGPGPDGFTETHGPRNTARPTEHVQAHEPREGPGPRRQDRGDGASANGAAQARAPAWAAPTVLLSQVGRAGGLTPAQAYRASQGHRR
ncbi:hypothetical protein BJ971_000934 [Actinoplanes digitatis]|uniref:Uncharacterized protein n=1 Tax=Actinoplanes digitatis TaxID=1868 RepID=A0A7W7HT92_9ACTN|nr:hypothetical protein [Actinoplanes digitatis]